ncbi:MAG: RNA polymerase sigma factor [Elusimicrobia bacterium]|nr:RNA polymerase sigma factor [Elusimicrobiota bacterium]
MRDQEAELADLIERSRRGDADVFSAVIRRYETLVYASAFKILGDHAAAQDVAQETFIAAFSRLRELRSPASFPAWLHSIARNKALSWRRSRGRQAPLETTDDLSAPPDFPAMETDADRREAASFGKGVREIVSSLSDALRVPVLLCYQGDVATAEAARFLDLKEGTLRKRLHDARKKLQARIVELAEKTLQEYRLPAGFAQRCICGCRRARRKRLAKEAIEEAIMDKKQDCGCGCVRPNADAKTGSKAIAPRLISAFHRAPI